MVGYLVGPEQSRMFTSLSALAGSLGLSKHVPGPLWGLAEATASKALVAFSLGTEKLGDDQVATALCTAWSGILNMSSNPLGCHKRDEVRMSPGGQLALTLSCLLPGSQMALSTVHGCCCVHLIH